MSKKLDEKYQKMDEKKQKMLKLRHTAEHVLHTAMQKLYPELKKAMGPATDEGFYFDFDYSQKVAEEDFPAIEKEMSRIIKSGSLMKKVEISVDEARKIFAGNQYKLEWLDDIQVRGEKVSTYQMTLPSGKIIDEDLCSGPHLDSVSEIKAFKLLSVAGAYWHGDEKNKMLTRIYGTAFESQEELDKYLEMQEEAKKRDHRKLGKSMDLFSFSDLVGSGLPLYSPRGAFIRRKLTEYVESVQSAQEYFQVWTPQIAKADLFKTSGHYDKYKGDMFRVVSNYSDEEMFLKPMNCPQHTQIYAAQPRSYRDLPLRLTDFAMLYRDEKPGELSGLGRVRSFSQDDCHIFCREDQVDHEIDTALQMTKEIMKTFGFKYKYRLSTRDMEHLEKYLGDPAIWEKTEKWAETIMERNNIEYVQSPGDAAFYAPKMDLVATDALGREWQLSTLQIDYVMPERFNLTYTDQMGQEKHPVMLHRAILGSAERLMMILIEHYGGNFPVWLSPTQVTILPVSEKTIEYSEKILRELKEKGIRVELNSDADSLGKKIRNAEASKMPYMLIIGEKEAESNQVSVRARGQKDLGAMSVADFVSKITKEDDEKLSI
ncbi:MAG: Threonine-tRNA ligase [Candidatus Collierbacteria bacterium GW2011_GWB1_44_6]|uniref:Threonine--tRNA ligase n=2 Tax=Candidatus Collieribacteriota TaxID=1752725 RepID=A0A0G1MLD8_9BACT|nr:MAG: Threonine-tRNA ligase [Candidatus Collierbacteria bacterium GW2011_GWC2_43_12]KKT72839.1 MAG: Threonine-tRNA ligase [Candidatus Collierbacteria bacterium GW2011_GWB1_44_6]